MTTMHTALQPLEAEIIAFEAKLPILRQQFSIGTYVLFAGSRMLGNFKTYREALHAGYAEVGLDPFLVKQICREGEDVQHVYGLKA